MAIHWSVPGWLWPLLLVVAAGAVLWTARVYARSRPAPTATWRRRLLALRCAALVLLLIAAAGPVLQRLGRERLPAELVVIVDDSASMDLRDTAGDRSRWEQATALAADVTAHLARSRPDVEVVTLRGSGLAPPAPLAPGVPPTGVGTDLDGMVAGALRRGAGRPLRGVLVVADGGETRRARTAGHAPAAAGEGARVLVAGVGDPAGAADRRLTDLRHPHTAHVGDEVELEFTVDHRGPARVDAPLRVVLREGGAVVVDTSLAGAATVPMRLSYRPARPGLAVLEIEASALPDERHLTNNRASAVVDVRPDRRRVLLLAPEPGWNVRFLAQAAAAEPRLEAVVVHRTPDGLVRTDSLRAWRPPRTAADWRDWDAVVLVGWSATPDSPVWTSLAAAVPGGLGLGFVPAPTGLGVPPLRPELLAVAPITVERWRWTAANVFAEAGTVPGHPVLAGVGDRLRRLPPVERFLAVRPRDGAEVVVQGRAAAGEDSPPVPLLVTASRGEGRVVWWSGPELWQAAFGELARGADETRAGIGRRFLRNLLVWTASGEEEAGLDFVGRAVSHPAGEPVTLEARWRDMRGRSVEDGRVRLVVRRADADSAAFAARTLDMVPAGDGTGSYSARLAPLPPGRYTASLTGRGDPPTTGGTVAFVVTPNTVEGTQVRRDDNRLETLARHWRGAAFAVPPAAERAPAGLLAALDGLDWSPRAVERRHRWDPWSGWPFLLLVCLLLGLEWFLRRRLGLL